MEEKIIRMIIYYVLAVNDDKTKNIDGCLEVIKLIIAMVKNEETKADRLLNLFPEGHPVSKLYAEIKKIDNEKLLELLCNCKNKFLNYNKDKIDFTKIEDDEEVEELSKEISLVDIYIFSYDDNKGQYTAQINDIEFYIDMLPTEAELSYVYEIAKNYSKKLDEIAQYMLQDDNFKEFFKCNNMLKKELIEKLNAPTIRIINENEATISYCNHTLDKTHIISFEFMGIFNQMAYLIIDG